MTQYQFASSCDCMGLHSFDAMQVKWRKFTDLKQQVDAQWRELPKTADVRSQPLKDKVKAVTARLRSAQIS